MRTATTLTFCLLGLFLAHATETTIKQAPMTFSGIAQPELASINQENIYESSPDKDKDNNYVNKDDDELEKEVLEYDSEDFKLNPLNTLPTKHFDYGDLTLDLAKLARKGSQFIFKNKLVMKEFVNDLNNFTESDSLFDKLASEINVFELLQVYTKQPYYYDLPKYKLESNRNYCDEVDVFNLLKPDNLFERNHVTSNIRYEKIKSLLPQITDVVPVYADPAGTNGSNRHISANTSLFYSERMEATWMLAMHASTSQCISQSYSFLQGTGTLARKSGFTGLLKNYTTLNLPTTCFDENKFFPKSYYLHNETECRAFFAYRNSAEYEKAKEANPIQFVSKIASGVHWGAGVNILDEENENKIVATYDNGELCGNVTKKLIIQKYISNTLTIYKKNKFDFRIYVLFSSSNPLIVYYHEGLLRVSLMTYDPNSKDVNRAVLPLF